MIRPAPATPTSADPDGSRDTDALRGASSSADSLPDLSIPEIGRRLRRGETTCIELVDACLERIRARDPVVGAFVLLAPDSARARAGRLDAELAAGTDRGPLHGIPFATKDLIDTAGVATTYGSRRHATHVPDEDAVLVTRLLEAGAVPLGKLATYEYALDGPSVDGPHPPPRNPWHLAHVTGGSSSGSAAAVAAGLVRVALGTDTGGSVRSPSSYCGVTGLKPTFGALPMAGIHPLAPSLDHAGLLAASAEEAGLVFEALRDDRSEHEPIDGRPGRRGSPPERGGEGTTSAVLDGVRLAYARDWFARDPALDPGVLLAIDAALSAASLSGARVTLVDLPDYPSLERAGADVLAREACATHRHALDASPPVGYGLQALRALRAGASVGDADRDRGLDLGARFRTWLDDGPLATHDVLITACTLTPAPPLVAFDPDVPVWTPMRTLPFNLSGHPVLALPCALVDGLPIGLQIVGRAGEETRLCRIGTALECSTTPLGTPFEVSAASFRSPSPSSRPAPRR